jgi:hypothetical protein
MAFIFSCSTIPIAAAEMNLAETAACDLYRQALSIFNIGTVL